MERYIPTLYQKTIYNIDYDKLNNRGIKCLLFDLDNTIASSKVKKPSTKLKKLFNNLQKQGFKLYIFSNAFSKRVKRFTNELNCDGISFAFKPRQKNFEKVMNDNKYLECEVAIIGDQMLTDIAGGNTAGITTILVNPLSKQECIFTKMNRIRENKIMKKLRDKDLFTKGKYYE
jgi:HAD superfamily phosphatase (TIGR01668 family)